MVAGWNEKIASNESVATKLGQQSQGLSTWTIVD
jgi:hypothetical protein